MSPDQGLLLSEWEALQRPEGWPFIQISRFDLPPRPQADSILGMEFPEDDEKDLSYDGYNGNATNGPRVRAINRHDSQALILVNVEDDSSEEDILAIRQERDPILSTRNQTGSEHDETNAGSETFISKAELEDIVADKMDVDRTLMARNQDELANLEAAEAAAALNYDADHIASLMNEFYDLLTKMGHWPPETVSKAPHSASINIGLGKILGYDERVLELMEKIPYIKSPATA